MDGLTAEERSWYGTLVEPAPPSQFAIRHQLANSPLLTLTQKIAFVENYDTEDRKPSSPSSTPSASNSSH